MDKSREQFEAWWCQYADEPLVYVKGQRSSLGGYYNEFIDRAWHGWQASRTAIEITPPEFIDSRQALAKGLRLITQTAMAMQWMRMNRS